MQPASRQGWFTVELPQDSAEFVFNNGENDWDSPMGSQNYEILTPGSYTIMHGKVKEKH